MGDYVIYKLHTLEEIDLQDILDFVRPLAKDYIWHYSSFHLVQSDPNCFQGKTIFEDSIADEWKIVDLLYHISNEFPVIIEVSDSDGEFLLIEAADVLPTWLDPLSAQGRVYIFKNQLHIIPREIKDPNLKMSIEAITSPLETRAPGKVQEALYSKIKMNSICQIHKSQIVVPHLIGHLLYCDPQLIAHCVYAFYTRDPSAIKVCQVMDTFKPLPGNMIDFTVSMTRMMYAQLESARFPVLKPFNMPEKESDKYKSYDLGMKIACGFEILYNDPNWNQMLKSMDSVDDYNFDIDAGWKTYQKRLEKIGYYRLEIKDSALYQVLEKQAKQQYLSDKQQENEYIDSKNPVQVIKELMKIPLAELEKLPRGPGDSDDWLTIDEFSTEKDLESKFAASNLQSADPPLKVEEEEELNNMSKWVNGFNDFIKVKSGPSGVLFPGETDDDIEDNSDFDSKKFLKVIMNSVGIYKEDFKGMGVDSNAFDSESDNSDDSVDLVMESEESETDSQSEQGLDSSFEQYLASMDNELKNSKVGSSLPEGPESDQVKMDMNLVQNLIDSFSAQDGLAGPVSNIMLSLNTPLPKNK